MFQYLIQRSSLTASNIMPEVIDAECRVMEPISGRIVRRNIALLWISGARGHLYDRGGLRSQLNLLSNLTERFITKL